MLHEGRNCPVKRAVSAETVVFTAAILALAAALCGCSFFGKEAATTPPPPGQLGDGTSVVGVWSADFADVSTAPSQAVVMTYTFTGSGAATIDVRDIHAQGTDCTASGPYTVDTSGNVDITIQAVLPPTCSFPVSVTLQNPQVSQYSLSYIDPTTGSPSILFAALQPQLELVGVWDFGGQGGVDWIMFDQNGYFLLQSEDTTGSFLSEGYYALNSGTLTLNFFTSDAGSVVGQLVFTALSNTGSQLRLTYDTGAAGASGASGASSSQTILGTQL